MTSRRFSIQFSVGSNSVCFPKMKEVEEILLVPDLNMGGTWQGHISSFRVLHNRNIVVARVKEILDGLHVKLENRRKRSEIKKKKNKNKERMEGSKLPGDRRQRWNQCQERCQK